MLPYVIKRILWMLPVFFFVALLSFAVVAILPGDYYTDLLLHLILSGSSYQKAHAMVNAVRVAEGMNRVWFVQFWVWFKGVVTAGDFGVSWHYLVRPENGLFWTLIVTGSSAIWAWVLGIPIGLLSAIRRNTWVDHILSGLTYIGLSAPPYVLGTLFYVVMFTYVNEHIIGPGIWGPVGYELIGRPLTWYKVGSHILHLLPAWFIVGLPMFGMVARHIRGSVSGVLGEPFITVARGKGIAERRVLLKHALRNAINPLVSLFGIMMPTLLTGSILIGPILGFPTFGQFLLNAVRNQNQQLLTSALMFYALFLLIGNLIADIVLLILDPRIRYD